MIKQSWLRTTYAVVLVVVCLMLAVVFIVHAWHIRNGDAREIIFPLGAALFLGGVSAMLMAQGFTRRRYAVAAKAMGFHAVPRDSVALRNALPALTEGRVREIFVSDAYCGSTHGFYLQMLNYSSSPAWWSRMRTVALVSRPAGLTVSGAKVTVIKEQANADLALHDGLAIVRASEKIDASKWAEWLLEVTTALRAE